MGFVSDALGFGGGGSDAADASIQASETQAAAQREALEYLKKQEALPTEFRDKALQQYGDLFLSGGLTSPTQEQIEANPLYQSILGTQGAAEDAVLRHQAATGGFRSGDTQLELARAAADIQRNALMSGYQDELARQQYNVSGLQSLAQLPSNAGQIAGLTAGIGQTLGQGQIAAAQAQQTGQQQGIGNLFGLANLGMQAYGTFSDDRLKDNLVIISETNHPEVKKYKWEWNDKANSLGLNGEDKGYLASEIEKVWPDLVSIDGSGYRKVNLSGIEKRLEGVE